ncbi:MAG: bifunctional diaminohydroxyphosphoribosylaminopyrimidine deaminase/5-amino-6-(5-phosphoribosylamino)uracil reductase RibD [Actinomycetota bacterium]|nr:bifunctional diaminohydroxyphosphoribosylaminopyrimidine deaminase/5-amino-6-(5-phosphoribosylamino)uracil reductase RibD [Actinomycetota bacterium]MDP9475709.1 bifunctional diaminohydroxyphosphoribosylaminopyrimidine deaminase/5-amino-6-(5-phosphoribosylamino)uracil reductase RibD [Actinomycetota bacterium]MDP9485613.1 bifunctional diaminohydroxyphosphoribosylaminopyrimidine deaminase/5-amino-6-(5-phosphoribosylamino)uracil reductase RibD [Actinomycetota bacterium]
MLEAVREGRLARGLSFPNPPVGAVLVTGGRVVARGHTQAPGRDHAEKDCLRRTGEVPPDAVLYVTLEPCPFFGKTAPCTTAIIGKGVRRVVVGIEDPDPRASGAGLRTLRRAGVEVTEGILSCVVREELSEYMRRFGGPGP